MTAYGLSLMDPRLEQYEGVPANPALRLRPSQSTVHRDDSKNRRVRRWGPYASRLWPYGEYRGAPELNPMI